MTIRCMMAISLLIASCVCMAGCTRDDRPVVILYTSADEYVARELIAAFEEDTGIRVRYIGDTEVKKTTGLVERLRAEHTAGNPQADVYWSSEVFLTIELADEGVLEPFNSDVTADWPTQFRDQEKHWYGFAARGRVIVYAPDRVSVDDLPTSWMDLAHERYRNRIVMADPRFGTTGGHLGAMKVHWNEQGDTDAYSAFIRGLADNNVRMLASGNAGVVRAVAGGEADFGMTDTDDVWAAQQLGMNVDLIYANHNDTQVEGAGTLLIPNTVARVRGGPNPETAGILIDYLLSERAERILAESVSGNIPLRPGLREEYAHLAVPDPLHVDFRRAAMHRREAVEEAMDVIGGR